MKKLFLILIFSLSLTFQIRAQNSEGYSDYFCDLGRALQDEIISSAEHQAF